MTTVGARKDPTVMRRYDIDWLRVLATFVVFLFHCFRFFDAREAWHVKNNQLTPALSLPIQLGGILVMPLFFVLSGVGTYFSLRSRTARSFVRARFMRLAVPLMTVGWFVLSPPQVYIERVTSTGYNTPPFSGSFLEYLPHYFQGIYGLEGNFALIGVHLWYLFWLFQFSLIGLPLFLYLRGARGQRIVSSLADLSQKPGGILLLALPLCLSELLLLPIALPGLREGGWFLGTFLILMVYGFLLPADARFEQAIDKHKRVALGLGMLLAMALVAGERPGVAALFGTAGPALGVVLRSLDCWLWIVAILGFGRAWLSKGNRALAYAGETILPFYMLHQTVIVVIGYFIRDWQMSILAKYILLSTTAFAIIMLLFEFAIRRFMLLRFLFGLRSTA